MQLIVSQKHSSSALTLSKNVDDQSQKSGYNKDYTLTLTDIDRSQRDFDGIYHERQRSQNSQLCVNKSKLLWFHTSYHTIVDIISSSTLQVCLRPARVGPFGCLCGLVGGAPPKLEDFER